MALRLDMPLSAVACRPWRQSRCYASPWGTSMLCSRPGLDAAPARALHKSDVLLLDATSILSGVAATSRRLELPGNNLASAFAAWVRAGTARGLRIDTE